MTAVGSTSHIPKPSPSSPKPSKPRTKHKSKSKPKREKPRRPGTPQLDHLEVVDGWNQADFSGWGRPLSPGGEAQVWGSPSHDPPSHLDRLRDLVPFWRDGVAAAEEGLEATRFEDFFRRLDEEEAKNGWGYDAEGWGKELGVQVWGPPVNPDMWNAKPDATPWGPPVEPRRPNWTKKWPTADDRVIQPDLLHLEASDNTPGSDEAWKPGEPRQGDNAPHPNAARTSDDGSPDRRVESWNFVENVARSEDASPERTEVMHKFYAMPTQEKVKKIQELVSFLRIHS